MAGTIQTIFPPKPKVPEVKVVKTPEMTNLDWISTLVSSLVTLKAYFAGIEDAIRDMRPVPLARFDFTNFDNCCFYYVR